MRKNATYWGLGLLVALGLSATAASNWGNIARFSAATSVVADAEDEAGIKVSWNETIQKQFDEWAAENKTSEINEWKKYATPVSVTPAPGATVNTSSALSKVTVTFYKNISLLRECQGDILVQRGGQTIQTIKPSDIKNVNSTGAYDITVNIDPLTVAGEYTIKFPEALVYCSELDNSKGQNSFAFEWNFTVQKDYAFTTAPANAEFAKLSEGQQFTMTFPEGVTVSIDRDIAEPDQWTDGARVIFRNGSDVKLEDAVAVTLKADGNKLIATLDDNWYGNMTSNSNTSQNYWAYIRIPAGAVTITDGTEVTKLPAFSAGHYYTYAIPSQNIQVTPAPSESLVSADIFKEIRIKVTDLPGDFAYATSTVVSQQPVVVSYDPETGKLGTTNMATYAPPVADEKDPTTMVYTMKDPTNATAVLNNPQLWEKGYYAIKLPKNLIKRTDADAGLNGIGNIITEVKPYYVDGVAFVAASSFNPAAGVVDPTTGLGQIRIGFASAMEAIADKHIKIYKEGDEANLINDIEVTDARYVSIFDSGKNVVITLPNAVKNVQGNYVMTIDEGAFRQASGNRLLSAPIKNVYEFPEVIPNEVAPSNGEWLSEISAITLTYPGATAIKINNDPATIDFKRGANFNNATAVAANLITATAEGNVVTLTPKAVYKTANANPIFIQVPGGFFTVTKDGKEYPNVPMTLTYHVDNFKGLSVSPSGTVNVGQMAKVKVFPPEGYTIVGQGSGNCKLYVAPASFGEAQPTGTSDTFMVYNVEKDEDGNLIKNEDGSVNIVSNGDYAAEAIPSGDYVLRLTGTFLQLGDADGNTLATNTYKGPNDFNYTLTNETQTLPLSININSSVETLPTSYTISAEGGALSYFTGFDKTISLKMGSLYYNFNQEFKDGKLILTLTDEDLEKIYAKNTYTDYSIVVRVNNTSLGEIPAGAFEVTAPDGKKYLNERAVFNFKVTGPISDPYYTVTPAAGTYKIAENPAGLTSVNIATDKDINLDLNPNNTINGMILKDGESIGSFNEYSAEILDNGSIEINLGMNLDQTAEYTLIFPRGYFLIGELKTPSDEYSLTYNVEGLESIAVASLTPADDAVINTFSGVTLNFDNVEIASVSSAVDIIYTVQNPAVSSFPSQGYKLVPVVGVDKKSVLLTFTEEDENALKQSGNWPVADPGFYTVNIDPNAVVITDTEGKQYGNAFTKASYTLVPETKIAYTPADGVYVSELSEMTLAFSDMQTVAKNAMAFGEPTLVNGEETIPVTVSVDKNTLIVSPTTALTAIADYELTVPAQYLLLTPSAEGRAPYFNGEIKHTFSIGEKPAFTRAYPVSGENLELFTNNIIYFNTTPSRNRDCEEVATLSFNGQVIKSTSNKSGNIMAYPAAEDDPNSISLNWTRDKNEFKPGEYTVNIPAGFVLLGGVPCDAIELNYTVLAPLAVTVSPLDGSSLETLDKVVFTYSDATAIKDNEMYGGEQYSGDNVVNGIHITSLEGDGYYDFEVNIDGNVITLALKEAAKLPGGNTIVVLPAGAFDLTLADGTVKKNDRLSVTYVTPNIPVPTLDFEMVDGKYNVDVFNKQEVTATLPEGEAFGIINSGTPLILKAVKEDGTLSETMSSWAYDYNEYGAAYGKNSIKFTCASTPLAEVAPGKYIVYFKRGSLSTIKHEGEELDPDVTYGGDCTFSNCQISWYLDVVSPDSVDSIYGDTDIFNIYTTDGKIVKINGNIDDVKGLDAGLYVINGRTTYIRK
ncbi:MAG: hypothetical protein HDS73_07165 [Bacteroidales bacterium]|nr:hypothetical protein [Bacteroidales bacterium]